MKKGNRVRIVSFGQRYSTYIDWIERYAKKYRGRYAKNKTVYDRYDQTKQGVVLKVAMHENYPDTLLLIELDDTKEILLISVDGVELIDEGKNRFIEKGREGKR